MSVETVLSTDVVELYVPLLNEGTAVFRPTKGIVVRPGVIRVLPTSDYDAGIEEWQFPPGSEVRCEIEIRSGREVRVARQFIA